MTILAVVVPNFGSVARLMMLLWNALSGPLIGVFLLALLFPCADKMGTSAATIMTIVFQMWLTLGKVHRGIRPARMEASTTKCTEYFTSAIRSVNQTSFKITEST
ncbi:sodium-dependent multivitamin transporter-like [Ixodes scapularis]